MLTSILSTLKKLVLEFRHKLEEIKKQKYQEIKFNEFMRTDSYHEMQIKYKEIKNKNTYYCNKFEVINNFDYLVPKYLLIYLILILEKIKRYREGTM